MRADHTHERALCTSCSSGSGSDSGNPSSGRSRRSRSDRGRTVASLLVVCACLAGAHATEAPAAGATATGGSATLSEGDAPPKIASFKEELSKAQTTPGVLTVDTFQDAVFDETKSALVKFFAPWCARPDTSAPARAAGLDGWRACGGALNNFVWRTQLRRAGWVGGIPSLGPRVRGLRAPRQTACDVQVRTLQGAAACMGEAAAVLRGPLALTERAPRTLRTCRQVVVQRGT